MVDKIRFAVIGLGGFGFKRVKSIVNSSSAELIYVVDIDDSKVAKIARDTGAEVVTMEELCHKSNYDVAIVATPNRWHEPIALRLIESGETFGAKNHLALVQNQRIKW